MLKIRTPLIPSHLAELLIAGSDVVSFRIVDDVLKPVKPDIVINGVHEGSSGTLVLKLIDTLLSSHGIAEERDTTADALG